MSVASNLETDLWEGLCVLVKISLLKGLFSLKL